MGGAGYFGVATGIAGSGLGPGGDDAGRTGEGDEAGWRAGVGGAGAGAGEADGSDSGLLQPEKGGSGLEIGGNSDSGGPDDTRPDGDVPGGPARCPRGAKGGRAETRKPQASQN